MRLCCMQLRLQMRLWRLGHLLGHARGWGGSWPHALLREACRPRVQCMLPWQQMLQGRRGIRLEQARRHCGRSSVVS